MSENRREIGQRQFKAVTTFEAQPPADPFSKFILDTVFGEIWSRPILGHRERRLIALTAIAFSGSETALQVHVRAAVDSGDLSLAELEEFVLHLAIYAGMPTAVPVQAVVTRIKADIDAAKS